MLAFRIYTVLIATTDPLGAGMPAGKNGQRGLVFDDENFTHEPQGDIVISALNRRYGEANQKRR